MRGELKLLCAVEIGDLEQYVPGDPECFGFHVMAFIGSVGDESFDAFNFVVCTPIWLARSFNDVRVPRWDYECENVLFGRRLVLMMRWDYQELHAAISEMCAGHEAADWGTLANRIGRYIPWEFDDRYDEFIDSAGDARPAFPPQPSESHEPPASSEPR